MHLIDQDLSGINQLGAIVGAISGYLCGKQFGQLRLTVDMQIICGEQKNGLQMKDMATVHGNEKKTKKQNMPSVWWYIHFYIHHGDIIFQLS